MTSRTHVPHARPQGNRPTAAGAARPCVDPSLVTAPDGPDLTPAAVLGLQRTVGNRSASRVLATRSPSAGIAHPDDVRERAEASSGYDLSRVRIISASPLAAAAGVEAATVADAVHVAPGLRLDTPHGEHVLAHELAHVVQQARGQTGTLDDPARYRRLEHAAEADARALVGAPVHPRSLHPLPSPTAAFQAFDPRYHRGALELGMAGTGFSPEEMGAIYASNWERDFSQGHPALGNVVIHWEQVKVKAAQDRLTDADVAAFNGSVSALLDIVVSPRIRDLVGDEAYGGYRFWEHMDNPAAAFDAMELPAFQRENLLRVPPGETIPQYLIDSREYIKAQLFTAATEYRTDRMDTAGVASEVAADWEQRQAELTGNLYGGPAPPCATTGERERMQEGVGAAAADQAGRTFHFDDAEGSTITATPPPSASSDGEMITMPPLVVTGRPPAPDLVMPPETVTGRAPTGPTGIFTPAVAAALGRASHALEDFFAHSNFVELAIGEPTPVIVLTGAGRGDTGTSTRQQLGTGTFGFMDKMHALSHKIRGIADEIDAEIPLIEHLTGRSRERPAPSSVEIGSTESPHGTEPVRESASGWDVLEGLGRGMLPSAIRGSQYGMALGLPGIVPGFLIGAGFGLREATESTLRDVVATREGAQMLHHAAEAIEDFTREHQEAGSHTAIAKDQPGHAEAGEEEARSRLKTIKFNLAYQLATEADRMVVGRMRTVFDIGSPESADMALQEIYTTLNSLLAPPDGHPLEPVIAPRREEARTELADLRRQQQERDRRPTR